MNIDYLYNSQVLDKRRISIYLDKEYFTRGLTFNRENKASVYRPVTHKDKPQFFQIVSIELSQLR